MQKRLTKSQHKILAGVFGGVANYFNFDPAWVRIIGAALIIFTGFFPGALLYLIASIVMPAPSKQSDALDGDFTKSNNDKEN